MTSYVPGQGPSSVPSEQLLLIEQRVTNNLLQSDIGPGAKDELRLMRNDIAQSLGIVPPIIPGD